MKLGEILEVFLDTTFILPFFQLDIDIDGFTVERFRKFLSRLDKVYVSELSIYEAKAKLFRLSRMNRVYADALENFGDNLAVLRDDERICFRPYTKGDDFRFNLMWSKGLGLDVFDAIIVAQSVDVGLLITEDTEILNLRNQEAFVEDPELKKLEIRRWKELC
ncbi:MAG: PIN domain-containing protein [Candidatus Bathyarchaeota archaeon]|nr:PIN domain-containing protein [Candidatus Bathyarchaeota archaeon]